MMANISVKIDVTKIDKTAMFKGAKGTYIDVILLENRDGTDQYGNDYMVVQGLSKERREAGEKGPILGNAKVFGQRQQQPPARQSPATKAPLAEPMLPVDDSSIPF